MFSADRAAEDGGELLVLNDDVAGESYADPVLRGET